MCGGALPLNAGGWVGGWAGGWERGTCPTHDIA
jgi:hypothetical protein